MKNILFWHKYCLIMLMGLTRFTDDIFVIFTLPIWQRFISKMRCLFFMVANVYLFLFIHDINYKRKILYFSFVVFFLVIFSRPELKDEGDGDTVGRLVRGRRAADLEGGVITTAEAVLELREEVRLLDDPVNLVGRLVVQHNSVLEVKGDDVRLELPLVRGGLDVVLEVLHDARLCAVSEEPDEETVNVLLRLLGVELVLAHLPRGTELVTDLAEIKGRGRCRCGGELFKLLDTVLLVEAICDLLGALHRVGRGECGHAVPEHTVAVAAIVAAEVGLGHFR
jgi:hypothetical protein